MDYAHLQRHVLSPIVKVKMCVCVCVCAAMLLCMTHPNWEGVCSALDFSPAVSACLKWWTREGINSRTALLLLPLCLTSFCLPHLFVLVSVCMFPHARLNSRTFTSWVCMWENSQLKNSTMVLRQPTIFISLSHVHVVKHTCIHTLKPL